MNGMFSVQANVPQVVRQLKDQGKVFPSVLREGLNRSLDWAETNVRRAMRTSFDRPVPFTLRSLRVYYASTSTLQGRLWFRQRRQDEDKLWAVPQIAGGPRDLKPMEMRLQRAGILPAGWFVVPGQGAPMDAHGNVSPGEITRMLNVLGTYQEAGYNKANDQTVARLRKGNAKKGVYGFEYWVNPAAARTRAKHLPPGIYRRTYTAFGQSVQAMFVFVRHVTYRPRLEFREEVQRAIDQHFQVEAEKALKSYLSTGSASGARRAWQASLRGPR